MRVLNKLLLAGAGVLALTSATYAADLIIADPGPGVMVDTTFDTRMWEGLYLGAHVGYGWGHADHVPAGAGPPGAPDGHDIDLTGFLVGAQIGGNFYLSDTIVAGIEGDISWTHITGEESYLIDDFRHSINWMGSVRGKLGFDAGAFLPYLTAGLAVASAEREAIGSGATDTQTHVGWTAGAGVDFAVTDDASLNLEYRYSDYGAQEYDTGGFPPSVDLNTHTIRAGFNWHF